MSFDWVGALSVLALLVAVSSAYFTWQTRREVAEGKLPSFKTSFERRRPRLWDFSLEMTNRRDTPVLIEAVRVVRPRGAVTQTVLPRIGMNWPNAEPALEDTPVPDGPSGEWVKVAGPKAEPGEKVVLRRTLAIPDQFAIPPDRVFELEIRVRIIDSVEWEKTIRVRQVGP